MAYEVVVPKHKDSLAAMKNLEDFISKNLLRHIYKIDVVPILGSLRYCM